MALVAHEISMTMDEDAPGPRARLFDPARTVAFMLAGNAHVTFQSERTGTRFTYRIQMCRSGGGAPSHFVAVLTRPDSYEYLGCIFRSAVYTHGRNSRIAPSAPSAVAFTWIWSHLTAGKMHPELGVWHEGRCGRCGRRLTDPMSIAMGLGPKCRGSDS